MFEKRELLNVGYFGLARSASLYSDMWPRLGAAIVKKKPLSIGFNMNKPNLVYSTYTTHAEYKAMMSAGFDRIYGATIYIYRELADGCPALAFPCESCLYLMQTYGIKKIYFTVNMHPFYNYIKL